MTPGRAPRRAWTADVVGVAWVLLAAGAVLTPALVHGASLGPFDLLSRYGLTSQPGVRVHYTGPGDQIDALIPWTTLAWTQVHHGHLPLWNPYSGLGLPLAFNWQSSVFSVPALVGYLFPVRLAYTVAMVLTLVVAGTGVYVLGRMLRLGVLGCAMAGTVYELSGPVMGWLGWPNASAMSWAGWVFAAGLFVLRGRHRIGAVALFALVLAFCVYAGQPEAVVLLGGAFAVFLVVVLVRARRLDGGAPILRPLVDLALATAAGAALSAPLALPGLQVGSASDGAAVQSYGALRPHDLLHLVFQGFDGLPVAGNRWFGPSIYPETAAYVGVIALVLAATGLFLRRAQPEVLAFGAVALVTGIVAFAAPVVSVIDDIVGNRSVAWHRAVIETAFALAVLAGVGTDALARSWRERPVRAWLAGGFVVLAVVLVAVWTLGRGRLPPSEAVIRSRSFLWPALETILGLAAAGALALAARKGRGRHRSAGGRSVEPGVWVAAALLVCETAFLVSSGAPLVSSSPTFLPTTPGVVALRQAVGASAVGFGTQACHTPPTLGILPNANVAYDVHELAVYDPMTPRAYFRSWQQLTGRRATTAGAPLVFCPALTTATLARRYGVEFVLDPAGEATPRGTVLVRRVGDEDLYRVPGAGAAVETLLGPGGTLPSLDAPGKVLPVAYPAPTTWKVETGGASNQVLRLHLTDSPGWRATIDGRPLRLSSYGGMMLQARVPPGRHVVELQYRPGAFTAGVALAGASVLALVAALVIGRVRRRR